MTTTAGISGNGAISSLLQVESWTYNVIKG
jgi:hypothetical protein